MSQRGRPSRVAEFGYHPRIKRVGVIGCGLMGSGIAEICARAGLEVVVAEMNAGALAAGEERIARSIERAMRASKISEDEAAAARTGLTFTLDLADVDECELIFEAVAENEAVKTTLFSSLSKIVGSETILASNTSSIPIVRLAMATAHPENVVGIHFFNPVPVMPLVEVIPSLVTSAETVDRATELLTDSLRKEPIAAKDRAGFIVNSLLVPYLLSAVRMFEAGYATAADIDRGMELGCGHPMGPLRLADFIGLDTLASIADVLYGEHKDPAYAAPPLLMRTVEAGRLGRKSGQGFYSYDT